jgi:exodeoxyribonuclease-3
MPLKIVNWNINSIRSRICHLLTLIKEHQPDIICLQELKCQDEQFPTQELEHLPYNLYIHGQKSNNGVAVLSKIPADIVLKTFPSNPLPEQARFIEVSLMTTLGFTKIICLYVPNGGEVGSDKYQAKMQFYDAFYQYLISLDLLEEKIILCADWNVAPFDIDVYNPATLSSSTCFTYQERQKIRTILNAGFVDNFRLLHPKMQEFSWWDYRGAAFERNLGMRIDYILSSSNLMPYLSKSFIDQSLRATEKASDHAPVIAVYDESFVQDAIL